MYNKAILVGLVASIALLVIYFIVVTLVSDWNYTLLQWQEYWPFITALAIGFGIQAGLYVYLRSVIKNASSKMLKTTGATSTMAMISCCSHYLVNVLPILGIAGVVTVIAQYQVELFWVGLAFNFIGIAYMLNKTIKAKKHL